MSYIAKLIPKPSTANPWLGKAAQVTFSVAKQERVTSRIQKSSKLSESQKINMLWRRTDRQMKLAEHHKALKLQASNNFNSTRNHDFLNAAKQHHAAMIGHQSIASHARNGALDLMVKQSVSNAHRAKVSTTSNWGKR